MDEGFYLATAWQWSSQKCKSFYTFYCECSVREGEATLLTQTAEDTIDGPPVSFKMIHHRELVKPWVH